MNLFAWPPNSGSWAIIVYVCILLFILSIDFFLWFHVLRSIFGFRVKTLLDETWYFFRFMLLIDNDEHLQCQMCFHTTANACKFEVLTTQLIPSLILSCHLPNYSRTGKMMVLPSGCRIWSTWKKISLVAATALMCFEYFLSNVLHLQYVHCT